MYYNSIYSQLFNFIPRYRFEKIVKSQTERKRSASYLRKQMLHIVKRQWNNASSEKAVYEARLSAYEAFCGNAAKYETPLDSGMKRSLFRLHVFCLDKAKKNGRGEDILILQPLVPQSSLIGDKSSVQNSVATAAFFAFFMVYILDNAIRGWYSSWACE